MFIENLDLIKLQCVLVRLAYNNLGLRMKRNVICISTYDLLHFLCLFLYFVVYVYTTIIHCRIFVSLGRV